MRRGSFLGVLFASLIVACSSDERTQGGGGGRAPEDPRVRGGIALDGPFLDGDCDPIAPTHCGFPFPSNVYLAPDDDTVTGRHVEFGATTLPENAGGVRTAPDAFRLSDGFSAGQAPMTHLPGATAAGLPTPLSIERSLEADCPTVLIDAETGERVPHFAELDVTPDDETQRAFMIRPVVRLEDASRYIVAIRGVEGADGDPLEPSDAFRALRDGTDSSEPSVELRRELYADVFARLEEAGVERDDLQIAWDFTTASRESNTGFMVHIRDQALAAVAEDGPAYRIEMVETEVDEHILMRVHGFVTVPLYLDQPGPGGRFTFGSDGLPEQSGTAEYPFLAIIPRSAASAPAKIIQYGHGLFGSRLEITGFHEAANRFNWVLVSMDFIGMSGEDVGYVADVIANRDVGDFGAVPDRLCQSFLNKILLTRALRGAFANDPSIAVDGASPLDTSSSYYFGGSQGGIFGASLMALWTDVTRGALAVPGQPYNLLLNRSVDFDAYLAIFEPSYPNALDIQLVLGLAQMLWDRAEPNGYSKYIQQDLLPETPEHRVLMLASIGDHQVTTLGAHVMARAVGAKNLRPLNRDVWGLEAVDAPHDGSTLIEYEWGLPPEPIENVPMREGQDPHGRLREIVSAGETIDRFLETGRVEMLCDGPCDPD